MNRFFKILREDGGIFDILMAENQEQAETAALFRPWHNVFLKIKVVECQREEWWSWRVMNWREIDRLENDMVSMDSF